MGIPKHTENSVTSLLATKLKNNGVNATPFANLSTPVGRREVDILCENSGYYPCEAKFTESDLLQAISKIQNDYFKYHKDLNVKGGFALLYPEVLSKELPSDVLEDMLNNLNFQLVAMFLPDDTRKNFTVYEGKLPEIAQKLTEFILIEPEYIEPNITWVINSLREAANFITVGLRHLAGEQLEDLFGGEHVFKNILQYDSEEEYPVEELRIASAYLLVNQLLFYHVLSRKIDLPNIDSDKIKSPSQLNEYFKLVLEINYRTIFSYDVVSRIPPVYTNQVQIIINVIEGISPEKIGGDLLGTIFHDLLPLEIRKYVAAYYTNVLAADLLAWLSINKYRAKVADFAIGSGGLIVAAYRRKKHLLQQKKDFNQHYHEKFIEDLFGVDVMPFAASIAASHLSLQSPEYHTDKVSVAVWDSTDLKPNVKIPSIAGLSHILRGQTDLMHWTEDKDKVTPKGIVQLKDDKPEEIVLKDFDVVIMNPPFTRQERIPSDYKAKLRDRFKDYKDYTHGQHGYYGYFILLADKFLKENGVLALVLPATVLRVRSCQGIIELLSNKYNIQFIITGKRKLNFSDSTWKREILLVAKKLKSDSKLKNTVFAGLENLPESREDLKRITTKLNTIKGDYEDHEISAFTVTPSDLKQNFDWYRFIAPFFSSDLYEFISFLGEYADKIDIFGDIFNMRNILEGIESRKGVKVQSVLIPYTEERAVNRNDYWIFDGFQNSYVAVFNRNSKEKLLIPNDSVVRCLRTTANNKYMDTTDFTDLVVFKDFEGAENFFFGNREIFRERMPVYSSYIQKRTGNLIIMRRFVINAPGTIHIANYSSEPISSTGTTWVCNFDHDEAKILCLWLNSSLNLAQIFSKRVEDVWIDIHKYILKEFLVINPKILSKDEKECLLKLFDEYSRIEFESLEQQYMGIPELKKEIDKQLLLILGFEEQQIDEMLANLYNAIKSEFEGLRSMGK